MKAGILESKKYSPAPPVGDQPNTFIGGLAASIPDAATLASHLNILESDISYFRITGNDLEAAINVSYNLPFNKYLGDSLIKNFKDISNVQDIGISAFQDTDVIISAIFPVATSVKAFAFRRATAKLYYIPNAINLGDTVNADGIFDSIPLNSTIVCHPSLATNNAGGRDGDIAYAEDTRGATIIYGANEDYITGPGVIGDLSAGQIYSTRIQVNFSPPLSANNISHYEVYLNGVYYSQITPGGYVSGLNSNTAYSIDVVAVDEFYNKGNHSNPTLSVSTNSVFWKNEYATANYKLDETTVSAVIDSISGRNGTNNGALINQIGKIGKSYQFSGSSKYVSVAANSVFSFLDGQERTLDLWVKFNSNTYCFIINRVKTFFSEMEWAVSYNNDLLSFVIYDLTNTTNLTVQESFIPVVGEWYHLAATYDGSKTLAGLEFYINSVKATIKSARGGSFAGATPTTSPLVLGVSAWALNDWQMNGNIDDVFFRNKVLTPSQVSQLYNNGNGITL